MLVNHGHGTLLLAAALLASGAAGAADLHVTPAAAYTGSYGLEVGAAGTAPAWVEDTHPGAAAQYRARVYVDADLLAIPDGTAVPILAAYDGGGGELLHLEIQAVGGSYLLAGVALDGAGTSATTPVPLHAGWQAAEVAWTTGTGDGTLEVYLDGSLAATLSGLDTGGAALASVRLGAPSGLPAGASGSLVFDCFDSAPHAALGLAGDANSDGAVTFADLPALSSGLAGSALLPPGADVNCDGTMDATDLSALIKLLF